MTPLFEKQLQFSDEHEDYMRIFMLRYGYSMIHTSRMKNEEGKGARLYLPYGFKVPSVAIPDFLCIKCAQCILPSISPLNCLPEQFFMDLKVKRRADFYRNRARWETGIDDRCRRNYLTAEEATRIVPWVFHLIYPTPNLAMDEQRVPDLHRPAPTGLFGCPVSQRANEYKGMVYWGIKEDMKKLAELQEVIGKL